MKQHWDCNSRRFSFADLECSAPYLPNPLLGKKNVLIKVGFFFLLFLPNFRVVLASCGQTLGDL